MADAWKSARGWLSDDEAAALASLARGEAVLELGSYCGRSTLCMADAGASAVVSVDRHRGDAGTGPADTLAEFAANLAAHLDSGRVVAVLARIEHAAGLLPDAAFGLAFIDSAHDADAVERDTRVALRCVRPGGAIAWHDHNYPSVREGIARCGLAPRRVAGTLAVARAPEPDPCPD